MGKISNFAASRVMLVKLVKPVKISNFGAIGDSSDKGNVGKVGKIDKISNFGAILIQQIYDTLKVDENIIIQIFLTKFLRTKLT